MKNDEFGNVDIIKNIPNVLNEGILNTTTKKFKRICPICKNELFYGFRESYWLAKKKNTICRKCNSAKRIGTHRSIEVRNKISQSISGEKNPFFGKHHSEKTKQILSEKCGHFISDATKQMMRIKFTGENNPFYGKKHTDEIKRSISVNTKKHQKGRKKSLMERQNLSKSLTGLPKSPEHKRKIGLLSKARILLKKEKEGILKIGYNPTACVYFDQLNVSNGWNLQHALNGGERRVLCYFIDAYDKNKNIVVEYDEIHHFDIYGKLKPRDIQRMNDIIDVLGCRFYRYNAVKKELLEYAKNYEVIHK